jgi:hypothetical protein
MQWRITRPYKTPTVIEKIMMHIISWQEHVLPDLKLEHDRSVYKIIDAV